MERISLKEYRLLRDKHGCGCWWKLPMDPEGFRAHVVLPHPYWIRCVTDNKIWRYSVANADEWQAWYYKEKSLGHTIERGTNGNLEDRL